MGWYETPNVTKVDRTVCGEVADYLTATADGESHKGTAALLKEWADELARAAKGPSVGSRGDDYEE